MIDPLGLSQVQMVRQIIAQYEDEIGEARGRLKHLRAELAEARLAGQARGLGDSREARLGLRARAIRHKVEYSEDLIEQMEDILDAFRRKLVELQRD